MMGCVALGDVMSVGCVEIYKYIEFVIESDCCWLADNL